MVTVMSMSNISVLLWKNGDQPTYSELVKQESVFFACSNDMHAYDVLAFDKN